MEVTGHKAHGPVPEPGSVVIARVSSFKYSCLSDQPGLKMVHLLNVIDLKKKIRFSNSFFLVLFVWIHYPFC